MHRILFALPLLAATACAQNSANPPTQFPIPHVQPHIPDNEPACPVGIAASRRGTPAILWTISQQDSADSRSAHNSGDLTPRANSRLLAGNGVHVYLAPSPTIEMPRAFLRVELAVDYLPLATRALPIDSTNTTQTLHKTYILKSGDLPQPSNHLEADLLVGQTSGILRVNLTRVDFADGTTWQAPTPDACSAKPSLYLPVSTR